MPQVAEELESKATEAEVMTLIALIDGPDPAEIVEGAKLDFKGLNRQYLISVTLQVAKRLDSPKKPDPENAAQILGGLMYGTAKDEDVFFEGELVVFSNSNANGSGCWIGASHAACRGLWRKSKGQMKDLAPKGNGFLELLK